MKVDWLIVGAGFTGATLAERIASQLDQRVLIVERRDHIGGNAYDSYNEHGVLIHNYGPHIFHTNKKKVWDYLSQFTTWQPYYHRVLGVIDGHKIPIPFNLNSLYSIFPPRYAETLESLLLKQYGFGVKVPILQLREAQHEELRKLANYIYQKVFYGYTLKQWGMKPEDLDPSVTGRVPIYISRDNRYFQDTYQGVPKDGYTELFRRMLRHPNIKVLLNTNYREIRDEVKFKRLIYTGLIDEFFDYKYGPLPYRSLRFEHITLDQECYQEVATVNYPNEFDFTRITEAKFLTGQMHPKTSITIEFPEAYVPEKNEPYYPVPRNENLKRYELYLNDAKEIAPIVLFAGRLGEYKYYNMDEAVERALSLFERECKR